MTLMEKMKAHGYESNEGKIKAMEDALVSIKTRIAAGEKITPDQAEHEIGMALINYICSSTS